MRKQLAMQNDMDWNYSYLKGERIDQQKDWALKCELQAIKRLKVDADC